MLQRCLLVGILLGSIPYLSMGQLTQWSTHPYERAGITTQQFTHDSYTEDIYELLDQTFDSLMQISPIKGMSVAMLLPDGSVWKRANGLASELPDTVALSPTHLMGMGSITKSFVAATLLLLTEEGLLSLDDTIGKYVSSYPFINGEITIRQLLSHRTGISDYLTENTLTTDAWIAYPDSIWELDTLLYHYILPPSFPPDFTWSYSNTNYLVAGRIIESVTSRPWYEIVRTRVLDPLGLSHTFAYPWEKPENQNLSHVWADLNGDGKQEDIQGVGLPVEGFFSLTSSSGCLISTAEDVAIFHKYLHGGHLLKPSTLAEMQTDYVRDPSNSGFMYGLGALQLPLDVPVVGWGHDGDIFYKAFAMYFPEIDLSIAILQNDDRSIDSNPEIIDLHIVFFNLLTQFLDSPPLTSQQNLISNVPIKVYPNPVVERLIVDCAMVTSSHFPLTYQLINVQGKSVMQGSLYKSSNSLFVKDLSAGLYILRVGDRVWKLQVLGDL